MTPYGNEIIAMRHVISVLCETATAIPKWSQKKNGESSVHADRIFPQQNGRTVPSGLERFHGKIGESSVSVNDCFLSCTGCTVHSRREGCVKKMASIPSMLMTALHSASATECTANHKAALQQWRQFHPCKICSLQLTQELC